MLWFVITLGMMFIIAIALKLMKGSERIGEPQMETTMAASSSEKNLKRQPILPVVKVSPSTIFQQAKDVAECLNNFPYIAPSEVPLTVRQDTALLNIVATAYQTTIGPDGKTQQTTIDAAERIRLQAEFKTRIFVLLDKCLEEDPEHGPAFLLYPKVAEYNTRAKDRNELIALYESFLPLVDKVQKNTKAYDLIKKDIDGMGGNYFHKVERHLADFHYGLARLYKDTNRAIEAKTEYSKANKLIPQIYGRGPNKIKL
jgi:tetratricopeptide (TPR) repeat protein